RTMTPREIRKHFSFKSSKRLNVTNLIKNLIWQSYTWIKQGKTEPLEGNIRSFWYVSVKPVLSRLGLNISGRRYTEKVYDAFVEMVTVHRLFRYADFGFLDERIYHRTIGRQNGNLILFIEKDGLFSIARRIAMQNQVTAISLGGYPSYLTSEYLVRNMAQAGLLRQPIHLFGVVDYDPGGYWIEREFIQQIQDYGVEVKTSHTLVSPDSLPKKLLEIAKYKLKKEPKTHNWLEATGGISGEPYGLEADALGGKRIRRIYEDAIGPYLNKPMPFESLLNAEAEKYLQTLSATPSYLQEEPEEKEDLKHIVEGLTDSQLMKLDKILQKTLKKRSLTRQSIARKK
ncbi:hypothetical protein KAT92_00555, partial [Candidatus Babeliales bacterium]|nr:hypothetical protein [Candidatus Babeliales bacterium]